MLSCALFDHPTLEAVLLNGNPLGIYGVRSLLSIAYLAELPQDVAPSHLSVLALDQCTEDSMLALDLPVLSPADPSGSYVFDLRDPWSSAAVQYCLRRWSQVRGKFTFEQSFPYLEIDGKAIKEIVQTADGRWDLPRSGRICFTFCLPDVTGAMQPRVSRSSTVMPKAKAYGEHVFSFHSLLHQVILARV
jgi:hypothetical protein